MAQPHLLGTKPLSCRPVHLGLRGTSVCGVSPQNLVQRGWAWMGRLWSSLQPGDSHSKPLSGPWNSIRDTFFFSFFDEK